MISGEISLKTSLRPITVRLFVLSPEKPATDCILNFVADKPNLDGRIFEERGLVFSNLKDNQGSLNSIAVEATILQKFAHELNGSLDEGSWNTKL